MAILAEELVQEWLNRQGYFTIRGVRLGVQEIDLLAIKPKANGALECRQVEVQISHNPISYICGLSKDLKKSTGLGAFSAKKRTPEQMEASVRAWIEKKFDSPLKVEARRKLCSGTWTKELVVNKVKFDDELKHIEACKVKVTRFTTVMKDLKAGSPLGFSASAGDFLNLIQLSPHEDQG